MTALLSNTVAAALIVIFINLMTYSYIIDLLTTNIIVIIK